MTLVPARRKRTSSSKWEDKQYVQITVSFRTKEDKDIIKFINMLKEKHGLKPTEIFRRAMQLYMIDYELDQG